MLDLPSSIESLRSLAGHSFSGKYSSLMPWEKFVRKYFLKCFELSTSSGSLKFVHGTVTVCFVSESTADFIEGCRYKDAAVTNEQIMDAAADQVLKSLQAG